MDLTAKQECSFRLAKFSGCIRDTNRKCRSFRPERTSIDLHCEKLRVRERDTVRVRRVVSSPRHTRLSYPLLCVPIYRVPIYVRACTIII